MAPDFSRDVHCVLGLPIDAVDMDGAISRLQAAVASGKRCFLSTPNLNFAIAAQSDGAFRDSVINSNLNLADGMPLIWVSWLLGIPLPERVAGSSMFERLRATSAPPLKVYFFGGPDGVAARACERLNAEGHGLCCVGFDAPGFGSIEEMSGRDQIDRINASGADFLVVSLGARKGQAWIESNQCHLHIPVVSHLGAVINFVAGSVQRAPTWMGRVGLEWLWRILQEPALWRRYASDGLGFVRLLATRVVPQALHSWWHLRSRKVDVASIEFTKSGDSTILKLVGAWSGNDLTEFRRTLTEAAVDARTLRLDLTRLTYADPSVIGLLSLLWAHRIRSGVPWQVEGIHPSARRCFRYACADYMWLQSNQSTSRSDREGIPC